jgi:FKBP-type peptidyl-prolyl cis-trans isomerase FkpA
MTPFRAMLLVVPALALAACDRSDALPIVITGDPVTLVYASSLNVQMSGMIRAPGGLFYRDLVAGSGALAQPGSTVSVQYTGWLPNGHKFDSSRDHGKPYEFRLGAGRVIPGWDEGLAGMRAGGRRQLVVPATLAYGSAGMADVIPPDAVLVFDVELVQVR